MRVYLAKLEPLLLSDTHTIVHNDVLLAAIERFLQLIVDTAVDINSHIIASNKYQMPDDYFTTFVVLGEHGILDDGFALKIASSVGLRNKIVHNYEEVRATQMINDIKTNIGDYKIYIKAILAYLDRSDQSNVLTSAV